MNRRPAMAAGVVLLAAVAFSAVLLLRRGPPVLLRYRWSPGGRLDYRLTLQGTGKAALASPPGSAKKERLELPVEMEGTIAYSLEAKEVSAEGVADLVLTITEAEATIRNEVRGRKMRMELDREGLRSFAVERLLKEVLPASPDFPLKGILDAPFRLRLDPRGKVVSCDLPSELKGSFPLPNLQQMIVGAVPDFPEASVRPGESWQNDAELAMPGVGKPWSRGETWKIRLASVLRKIGREQGKSAAFISFSGGMEQQWTGTEEEKRQDAGIKSFAQTLSGERRFDLERGMLLGSRETIAQQFRIFMSLDRIIEGNGFDVEVDFSLRVETLLQPGENAK
jgi:hypothetical protein